MVREAWTDERLDDLKEHMDEGFREVRADLRSLQGEVGGIREGLGEIREELGELRAEINGLGDEVDGKLGGLRGEMKAGFAAMNRTLQIAGGLIGAMFVGLMGLIGTQL